MARYEIIEYKNDLITSLYLLYLNGCSLYETSHKLQLSPIVLMNETTLRHLHTCKLLVHLESETVKYVKTVSDGVFNNNESFVPDNSGVS